MSDFTFWTRVTIGWALVMLLLSACSGQVNPQQFVSQFQGPCASQIHYLAPAWSPDGKQIAFYSEYVESRLNLIAPDGRVLFTTQEFSRGPKFESPAWSPDGRRLAIISDWKLAILNSDGTGLTQLSTGEGYDRRPIWSPDGEKIVFITWIDLHTRELKVINADGTGLRQLNRHVTENSTPDWSPDGKKVLFEIEDGDGLMAIAVMDLDATTPALLTEYQNSSYFPSWSSDGKRIIYVLGPHQSNQNLYVMDSDGTNVTQLTNLTGDLALSNAYVPYRSPDGHKIAFIGTGRHFNTVLVMNRDGTGTILLPLNYARGLSWSPDSKQVAVTVGTFAEEIFLVNSDGTHVRQLTQNPANQTCFRWPF